MKPITIEDIEKESLNQQYFVPAGAILPQYARNYAKKRGIQLIETESNLEPPSDSGEFSHLCQCHQTRPNTNPEQAIITATGINRYGIMAALTRTVSEAGVDIIDISQTLVGDNFTVIMIVNIAGLKLKNISFKTFKDNLVATGKSLNIELIVIHEEILKAVQRV